MFRAGRNDRRLMQTGWQASGRNMVYGARTCGGAANTSEPLPDRPGCDRPQSNIESLFFALGHNTPFLIDKLARCARPGTLM
ncbi:MAG: hypothetical protein KGK16_12675, partial [Bradyrhizobium sp.]|nr:hypothetical protein [Bradyrhizobium sp.]